MDFARASSSVASRRRRLSTVTFTCESKGIITTTLVRGPKKNRMAATILVADPENDVAMTGRTNATAPRSRRKNISTKMMLLEKSTITRPRTSRTRVAVDSNSSNTSSLFSLLMRSSLKPFSKPSRETNSSSSCFDASCKPRS